MSRSILSLGVIAVIIGSGESMLARGQGPPCELPAQVPEFLQTGADGTVLDFAHALAEARVSAGFVVSDEDSQAGSSRLWPLVALTEGRVPLDRVLAQFLTTHPDYAVTRRAQTLFVMHRALEDVAMLDRAVSNFQVTDVYLNTAFNEVQRVIDPTIPQTGGLVGSIVGRPGAPTPDPRAYAKITLAMRDTTVGEVMDTLACQVPGVIWILTAKQAVDGSRYYQLALRKPEGIHTPFHHELR